MLILLLNINKLSVPKEIVLSLKMGLLLTLGKIYEKVIGVLLDYEKGMSQKYGVTDEKRG